MNMATELKNASTIESNPTTATATASNPDDDMITIRIPKKVTLQMPKSFQLEIPRGVGYALIGGGTLALLSIVTGGAIWRFWWLIFFIQPWFWGKGYRGGGSKRTNGWHKTDRYSYQSTDSKNRPSTPKPDSTQGMVV